jgi:hypothetical protein
LVILQREAESATAGPSIQRNRRRSVISSGDEREEVFRVSELSLLIMSAEHLPKKDWLFGKVRLHTDASVTCDYMTPAEGCLDVLK